MGLLWFSPESDLPDLFGKVAIVTAGGGGGIGYEVGCMGVAGASAAGCCWHPASSSSLNTPSPSQVCKQLCRRQCTVYMAVRDLEAGQGWVGAASRAGLEAATRRAAPPPC
jgi:hypothetical protein